MITMQENSTLKNLNQLICKLSDLAGIIPFYTNYRSEKIEVSLDTKAKILLAMGFSIDEESLSYWIEHFESYPWKDIVEPVYVVDSSSPIIFIYLKDSERKNISIEIFPFVELGQEGEKLILSFYPDADTIAEQKIFNDGVYYKYSIPVKLQTGYYKIQVFLDKNKYESVLIVTPQKCFASEGKTWGIHCHLWSLRGGNREGNFLHLKEIAEYVNKSGGFVSIDPLHLNDPEEIMGISPYSALSRQFKTPLYISQCPVLETNPEFFDYPHIWHEKISLLKEEFEKFYNNEYLKNSEKAEAFLNYKKSLSPLMQRDLKYFAIFCFLRQRYGKDWRKWNENFKIPQEKSLDRIYYENEKDILFYEYLQWLVNEEIEKLKAYKLCFDLGFGSIKSSFDVWINQDLYALSAEYGAPPDNFNPNGQKWGFPPFIPFKMKEFGYLPFIKVLRSNMNASILRIDHALGLFRAFWIPEGCSPQEGAYVRHPWNDMLGIIALESQINKTEIIGEDLGTAENWMKEELIKREIYSWRVFYFEKDAHGFKSSDVYPVNAVCSITTHDLPTLKGFWLGRDIELRKKLSIFDEIQTEQAINERQFDKEKIIEILMDIDFQVLSESFYEELFLKILKFLSGSPSRYLLLYLEDVLLLEEQINLPGTTVEHPNWQKKLPLTVNEIINLPRFRKIENILKESGRII